MSVQPDPRRQGERCAAPPPSTISGAAPCALAGGHDGGHSFPPAAPSTGDGRAQGEASTGDGERGLREDIAARIAYVVRMCDDDAYRDGRGEASHWDTVAGHVMRLLRERGILPSASPSTGDSERGSVAAFRDALVAEIRAHADYDAEHAPLWDAIEEATGYGIEGGREFMAAGNLSAGIARFVESFRTETAAPSSSSGEGGGGGEREQVVREVIAALENGYHPQNPSPAHPADFVAVRFGVDADGLSVPDAAPPSVSDGGEPPLIEINGLKHRAKASAMTGAELRYLPTPPVADDMDLFEVVTDGEDRLVSEGKTVELDERSRFFTAPRFINAGAPASDGEGLRAGDLRELAEAAGVQAERWRRDGHEFKARAVEAACRRAVAAVGELPAGETGREQQLVEFDAWLSMRGEFREVLTAFRRAFGTDTSAAGESADEDMRLRDGLAAAYERLTDGDVSGASMVLETVLAGGDVPGESAEPGEEGGHAG